MKRWTEGVGSEMQTGLKNNERTSVSERGGELRVLKIEMGR
jgi:hypothetical protein